MSAFKDSEENKMSDYDDEDIQDFNVGFEEYYECDNMDAAYLHDNGMVWDKNEKYIGKFTDDGFVKASTSATTSATSSTSATTTEPTTTEPTTTIEPTEPTTTEPTVT